MAEHRRKMGERGDGKLIPPETVIAQELEDRLEAETRAIITERILREANLEGQVAKALKSTKRPSGDALINGIRKLFKRAPEKEWRAHVEAVVAKITKTRSR
jgi:hypothetical protein